MKNTFNNHLIMSHFIYRTSLRRQESNLLPLDYETNMQPPTPRRGVFKETPSAFTSGWSNK